MRVLLVLSILLIANVASAGKPKIAILGLESAEARDVKAIKFSKELTEALRSQAKIGSGPYQLAPGSDKDLVEMKLLQNCESEAVACMAAIGSDLGADMLAYGRVEKQPTGFKVTVRLLDVPKKLMARVYVDLILFADADSPNPVGKKLYAKLVNR